MKKLSTVIIAVAIACCLPITSHQQKKQLRVSGTHPTRTLSSVDVLALYQLMKDVHELLTLHNIEYWIDGGTLLGAIRHHGLIAWDDDLDIDIYKSDVPKIEALKPIFEKLGYTLTPVYFGYKLWVTNGTAIDKWFKLPCIDFFFMVKEGNEVTFDPALKTYWALRNGRPVYHTLEELYPLSAYTFGELTIMGPHNPTQYLNALYGKQWYDIGYRYDALTEKKEKYVLTDNDRVPAGPTGPLVERVR